MGSEYKELDKRILKLEKWKIDEDSRRRQSFLSRSFKENLVAIIIGGSLGWLFMMTVFVGIENEHLRDKLKEIRIHGEKTLDIQDKN